jgi:hypothetical protein
VQVWQYTLSAPVISCLLLWYIILCRAGMARQRFGGPGTLQREGCDCAQPSNRIIVLGAQTTCLASLTKRPGSSDDCSFVDRCRHDAADATSTALLNQGHIGRMSPKAVLC